MPVQESYLKIFTITFYVWFEFLCIRRYHSMYSSVPNRRAGENKRAGGKILKNCKTLNLEVFNFIKQLKNRHSNFKDLPF